MFGFNWRQHLIKAILGEPGKAALREVGEWVARKSRDSSDRRQRAETDLREALLTFGIKNPQKIPLLTHKEVQTFFATNRKKAPRGSLGGLLREIDRDGWLVTLSFLDSKGGPLPTGNAPGRAYLTKRLDDDLSTKFGEKDLVIFTL